MDANLVRVKLELDLIDGEHFNPENKSLSDEELINEATESFISFLDSWCNDPLSSIREYVQAKIIKE